MSSQLNFLLIILINKKKKKKKFKKFADVIIPNYGGGISFDPDDKINKIGLESESIHPVIHVIVEWIGKVCSWELDK